MVGHISMGVHRGPCLMSVRGRMCDLMQGQLVLQDDASVHGCSLVELICMVSHSDMSRFGVLACLVQFGISACVDVFSSYLLYMPPGTEYCGIYIYEQWCSLFDNR